MQDFVIAFDIWASGIALILWTVYFFVSIWPRWKRSLLNTLPRIGSIPGKLTSVRLRATVATDGDKKLRPQGPEEALR